MNAIKSLFLSLSMSSDLEKILLKLETSDEHTKPSDKTIAKIQSAFLASSTDNHHNHHPENSSTTLLVQRLTSQTNWSPCLKMLYTVHKLIHSLKFNITYDILASDSSKFGEEVHIPITTRYFDFLLMLCRNYSAVMECHTFFESEETAYLNKQSSEEILSRLSPLISGLKKIFKVHKNLSFALENFSKFDITKQVGLMIIKEAIVIFDFISAAMSLIQERIMVEESAMSMRIYGAYEEVAALNNRMEKLYGLRNLTLDPYLRKPCYFKLDKHRNKQFELHVNSLRQTENNSNNVTATVEKSIKQSNLLLGWKNTPAHDEKQNTTRTSNSKAAKQQEEFAKNYKCVMIRRSNEDQQDHLIIQQSEAYFDDDKLIIDTLGNADDLEPLNSDTRQANHDALHGKRIRRTNIPQSESDNIPQQLPQFQRGLSESNSIIRLAFDNMSNLNEEDEGISLNNRPTVDVIYSVN